jgi:CBS domain-containing protein
MTLSIILGRKGRDVVTVPPEQTLRETVQTLSDMKIGAIVVADGSRRVLGILSERDIIRAVAKRDTDVLADPVSEHMTRNVVTAQEDTTIPHAMERMTEGRFRHLPITDDGRLVGIVSIGDLVKHRLSEMETENQALHDYIAAV